MTFISSKNLSLVVFLSLLNFISPAYANEVIVETPGVYVHTGDAGTTVVAPHTLVQTPPASVQPNIYNAPPVPSAAVAAPTMAGYVNANLPNVDFHDRNLAGADFTNATLTGANFSGANLVGAVFTNATLSGADLTHAQLEGANLVNASLVGANLTDANLSRADLANAKVDGALAIHTKFKGANLVNVNMKSLVRH